MFLLDCVGRDVVFVDEVFAVYGTLREGGSNAGWWKELGVAQPGFRLDGFRLMVKAGYGFPVVVEDPASFVCVDLLWPFVGRGAALLEQLDVLEGYPRLFGRRLVSVTGVDGVVVDGCWLYVPVDPLLFEGLRPVGVDWLEFVDG